MPGENQDESPSGDAQEDPDRTARSEKGSQEIDRPDLELNYQGNSLVIDMSLIEWIAFAVIIVMIAILFR